MTLLQRLGLKSRAPVLLLAAVTACGSGTLQPVATTGGVAITTSTTGSDLDADGYIIALLVGSSEARAQPIPANGTKTFDGLSPDSAYSVELDSSSVASNCAVASSNPQTVTVKAGDTTSLAFNVNCAAATAGGHIVFPSNRDGDFDIYIMKADGSGVRNLTPDNPGLDDVPTLSRDGSKIAFYSFRNNRDNILVMDTSGANLDTLVYGGAVYNPAWSPDGASIAFDALDSLQPVASVHEIWEVTVQGGQLRQVTHDGVVNRAPDWSPDGTTLVFQSQPDTSTNPQLATIEASGASRRQLTDLAGGPLRPSWSPDGSKIAFSAIVSGGGNEIFTVAPTPGTTPQRLTNNPSEDLFPDWSPDGTQLTFTSNRDGNQEVYTMDAAGMNQTRRTNDGGTDNLSDWGP